MAHHFICYSEPYQGLEFAFRLADSLAAGPPSFSIWIDKRNLLHYVGDWDVPIEEAIRLCDSIIFIMTPDSVEDQSVCKNEWVRALKYKKPIVPVKLHAKAELPFRLGSRQLVDFTAPFETALAKLRTHLQWLSSPAGHLQSIKDRLADARRDLRRAADDQAQRILKEIRELEIQIAEKQMIVDNPRAALEQTRKSIETRIEVERQPEKPACEVTRPRFINPPLFAAPSYYQDRYVETGMVGDFLKEEACRLITIVGRAGIGKSTMVFRLLKSLEGGKLPDDHGILSVEGIVYLSALGSRKINFPTLFTDLCRLLPDASATRLEKLRKNPRISITAKMDALLAEFPQGRTVLLLDNFEDMMDLASLNILDPALDETLRALLNGPLHGVKVIITTRFAPRDLMLLQPGRQGCVDLDVGLGREDAIKVLKMRDAEGKVGLKSASNELLTTAWERTLGFPRALESLYAILLADRDTTLEEILGDTTKLLPENVVEALVGEAFNRLDLSAQQVMEALAIFQRPVTATAVDYLLSPYVPGVNSAPVLSRLVNMRLARKEGGRLYYLHPVDRSYALSRIPQGVEEDRFAAETPPFTYYALLHRGADFHREVRTPTKEWKSINDMTPQLAEFDMRYAGNDYNTAAGVLSEIDVDYLIRFGHSTYVLDMRRKLDGKITDRRLLMLHLFGLASAFQVLGPFEKAKDCFQEAHALARDIGDATIQAKCLSSMAEVSRRLGRLDDAGAYLDEVITFYRLNGDQTSEARLLGELSILCCYRAEVDEAIRHGKQALNLSISLGDLKGQALAYDAMSLAYLIVGNFREAIRSGNDAIVMYRRTTWEQTTFYVLNVLGLANIGLGNMDEGLGFLLQAQQQAHEVNDFRIEGLAFFNLARAYRMKNEMRTALEMAVAAKTVFIQINASEIPAATALVEVIQAAEAGRKSDEVRALLDCVRYSIIIPDLFNPADLLEEARIIAKDEGLEDFLREVRELAWIKRSIP